MEQLGGQLPFFHMNKWKRMISPNQLGGDPPINLPLRLLPSGDLRTLATPSNARRSIASPQGLAALRRATPQLWALRPHNQASRQLKSHLRGVLCKQTPFAPYTQEHFHGHIHPHAQQGPTAPQLLHNSTSHPYDCIL